MGRIYQGTPRQLKRLDREPKELQATQSWEYAPPQPEVVERVVEVIKEVIVDRPVEVIVEKPIEIIKEVVRVERVEVPVEKVVEIIKEIKVPEIREVTLHTTIEKEVLKPFLPLWAKVVMGLQALILVLLLTS